MKIPFNNMYVAEKSKDMVFRAIDSGKLCGGGAYGMECAAWFAAHHPSAYFSLTHSCTASLEITSILLNLQPGDEVIMPSYTFVSTANAFVLRGAVPVFVDVQADTMNIDPVAAGAAITKRTKAIVPMHYAGVACDMDSIAAVAKQHGVAVIEDAAQAILSEFQGKPLGTLGDAGCYSFHETKNVGCGEGGGLSINRQDWMERTHLILEKGTNRRRFIQGQVDKYTWEDVGSSFLPNEMAAAMLAGQLLEAHDITKKRYALYKNYYNGLCPLHQKNKIMLPYGGALLPLSSLVSKESSLAVSTNAHCFYLFTRSTGERASLIAFLEERGISAVSHYVPLHSSEGGRKFGRVDGVLSVTDSMSPRLLRLPLYPELQDQQFVIDAVLNFYSAH